VSRIFLLSLTAALNPTLLTAATIMLLLPSPKRLMMGYLGGALTTGVIAGVAIVEWLSGSGAVSSTKHTIAPGIDLALGALALIGAYVVQSGRVARSRERRREKHAGEEKKTPRWQEALSGGSARTTYLVGLLLSFPGASYLGALTELSRQDFGFAGVVVTVIAMNAVMLVLLEVPLVCFTLAPEWTPRAIDRFKSWMALHGSKAIVIALTILGAVLIVRGLLEIVA
jgi:Sap-like sulfolipid-1-addressing protein